MPDDSRKKSFRREKSFKDDRRPPREGNEDFGHRGGSFRGRYVLIVISDKYPTEFAD